MKKIFTLLAIVIAVLFSAQKASATHAAGGELIYNLKAGTTNTYVFFFKFYRNCANPQGSTLQPPNSAASTEPASFTLCYTSPCTGNVVSVNMPKVVGMIATTPPVPNGTVLSNGCNNNNTTCDILQSSIYGYREWWYTAEVTLPSACDAWRFWVTLCCRNNAILNVTNPGSQNIYVQATLDNSQTTTMPSSNLNNSARFLNSNSAQSLPIPYVCLNSLFVHNGGAIDPDGDSLTFETITPRHHGGCTAANPTDILIIPTYDTLNVNGNPLACNNTYNLNTATGEFSFTPTQVGPWVISQKITEWRYDANGVAYKVGTVMRDMQIMVDNCVPLPAAGAVDSSSVAGGSSSGDTVKACPGAQLTYCFDIASTNQGTYVIWTADNHVTSLVGSSIVYTKPNNYTLRGCVTWTPTLADTGFHNLIVAVKDTMNCLSNPAIISFPVYVNRPLKAWNDTAICLGQTANLSAFANGFYNWSVLPGGSGTSSISCLGCPNPLANDIIQVTPTSSTFYVATDLICGFTDTVEVQIQAGPPITMSPDTTTCVNSTQQISVSTTGSGTYSYSWVPTTGLDNPNIANPTLITPTTATTFTVTVTPLNSLACPTVGTVNVDVLKGYLIGNNDTTICNGDFVQIGATGGNPKYTYQWTPTTFVNNPNNLTPVTITPTPPGSYPFSFVASYPGCPDSIRNIVIDVEPIPQVNAGLDRILCDGDTLHLSSTVAPFGLNYSYNWAPSIDLNDPTLPDPTFSGHTNTVFTLEVTTPAGCLGSDIVIMNVSSTDFLKTAGDTSICPNQIAKLVVGGGASYLWSPSLYVSDSTGAKTDAFPQTTTDFFVYGYNFQGCSDTARVTVVVHPDAHIDLGDDKTIYPSESVQIYSTGNCSFYSWYPPNGLNATNLSNPIAQPSVTTRYYVNAETEYGCKTIDSINVIVRPETLLELPNAFSPGNGSSINDGLKIIVRGSATLNSYKIFNRWGQLVFSTTDINEGWNGQFNGKPQPLGSYVYVIEATSSTGKRFTKQGNVSLLR